MEIIWRNERLRRGNWTDRNGMVSPTGLHFTDLFLHTIMLDDSIRKRCKYQMQLKVKITSLPFFFFFLFSSSSFHLRSVSQFVWTLERVSGVTRKTGEKMLDWIAYWLKISNTFLPFNPVLFLSRSFFPAYTHWTKIELAFSLPALTHSRLLFAHSQFLSPSHASLSFHQIRIQRQT